MNNIDFEKITCAAVSDVMEGLGIMDPGIINMVPGKKIMGTALTVKCYPGSILTVHKAILEAKAGEVLVVDDEGDQRGAVFGELMAMECQKRLIAGVVIDGPVRDVNDLIRLKFPTFARYRTPRVGTNRRLGKTKLEISCGGIVVRTADYIFGDDDGVAVIPEKLVQKILAAAMKVEAKEDELASQIKNGDALSELIGLSNMIR